MELEITWKRACRVWWSFFWRYALTMLVVVIGGYLLGFVVGYVLSAIGFSSETVLLVGTIIGCAIVPASTFVPLKMILGKKLGKFRLVLLADDAQGGAVDR